MTSTLVDMELQQAADRWVKELLPAVTDSALRQTVAQDVAAGEPLIALITLIETAPELVPVEVLDGLEGALADFDTLSARIGRKVITQARTAA